MRTLLPTLFFLSITAAQASEHPRRTLHLDNDGIVGGVSVKAGTVEIFQPGGEFAEGTLAEQTSLMGLSIPAGTKVDMEEPGNVHTLALPSSSPYFLLAGAPYRGGNTVTVQYSEYYATLKGRLVRNPDQVEGFPSESLNREAFSNDVFADCMGTLRDFGEGKFQYFCNFHLTLAHSLAQNLGNQTVQIPAGAKVHFEKYGLDGFELAQDDTLLGLPVSATAMVRINRYSADKLPGIMSLTLSADAEYQGQPLSAGTEVEFYDADENGISPLRSFVPSRITTIPGGSQTITLAAGKTAHVNRDGSLHYGYLGETQKVHAITIPGGSLLFLGESLHSTIGIVGLEPRTTLVVDGISYGPSLNAYMYIDFNAQEHIYRVR